MERFEAYQEALKILNALLEHAQMDHAPNGEDAYAIAEFLTTLIYHLERLDTMDSSLNMKTIVNGELCTVCSTSDNDPSRIKPYVREKGPAQK